MDLLGASRKYCRSIGNKMANIITNNLTNNITSQIAPISITYIPCTIAGNLISSSTNISQSMNFNTSVWFTPFFVNFSYTITALSSYVVTAVAASTITLGIYANQGAGNNDLPSGAALAVGQVASTSQGMKTITISQALNPNTLYWAAIQVSTNTTLAMQVALQGLNCGGVNFISAGVGLLPGSLSYTNTYSAGTLPSVTSASVTIGAAAYLPVIFFT